MSSLFNQPQGNQLSSTDSAEWRFAVAVLFALFGTAIFMFVGYSLDPAGWLHGFLTEHSFARHQVLVLVSTVSFSLALLYLVTLALLSKYKKGFIRPSNNEMVLFWLGSIMLLGQVLGMRLAKVWYGQSIISPVVMIAVLELAVFTALYLYFRKGRFSGLERAALWCGVGSLLSKLVQESVRLYALLFNHSLNYFLLSIAGLLTIMFLIVAAWFLIRRSSSPLEGSAIALYWLGFSVLTIRMGMSVSLLIAPVSLTFFVYSLSIGTAVALLSALLLGWLRRHKASDLERVFYWNSVAFLLIIMAGYVTNITLKQQGADVSGVALGYLLTGGFVAFATFTVLLLRWKKMTLIPLFFYWLCFAISFSLMLYFGMEYGYWLLYGEAPPKRLWGAASLAGVVSAVVLGLWIRWKNVSFAGGRVIGFEFAVFWFVLSLLSVWTVVGVFIWQKWQPWPERFLDKSVYNNYSGQAGMMLMAVLIVLTLLVLVWQRRRILTWLELIVYSLWGSFLLFEVGKGLLRPFAMPQKESYMVLGGCAAVMVLYFIVLKLWQKKATTAL